MTQKSVCISSGMIGGVSAALKQHLCYATLHLCGGNETAREYAGLSANHRFSPSSFISNS